MRKIRWEGIIMSDFPPESFFRAGKKREPKSNQSAFVRIGRLMQMPLMAENVRWEISF